MADNALYRRTKQAFAEQFNRETPQDYPVVQRSSLLPLATYGNGQTGLAWPGFIAEDIPNALTAPSRAYNGEMGDYLDNRDAYLSEGLNFAGTAAVGGSVVPKPTNAAGMFGGRLARTADQNALARAEELAAKGAPREDIWNQTGWFKGVDGKWRFEIDDSGAAVYPGYLEQTGRWEHAKPFRDVMDHYGYLSAYPDAENITMQRIGGQKIKGGGYNDGRMWFNASGIDRGRNIALHELQHDAQRREGFARGGSARQFTDEEIAAERARRNAASSASGNGWDSVGTYDPSISNEAVAHDLYARLAGEVEARAVQARSYLTADERRARPPWLDYDVPEGEQIVRFGNGPAASIDRPTNALAANGVRGAGEPRTVRAYHGTNEDFTAFDPAKMGSRGLTDEGAFFFGSKDIANEYADSVYTVPDAVRSRLYEQHTTPDGKLRLADYNKAMQDAAEIEKGGRVIPADIDVSNFGSANLPGYRWDRDEGARVRSAIERAKAEGKDGLVINGMTDATGIADPQYAVWGRGTVRSPLSGDLLYANGRQSSLPGTLLSEAGEGRGGPIRAYHGSPHDFDKFDLSKIGTGEGAQAFGHGLYFAENEGVARSYRDNLSVPTFEVPRGLSNEATSKLREIADAYDGKLSKSELDAVLRDKRSPWDQPAWIDEVQAAADNGTIKFNDNPGRMYEVNIHANPDDFLDWDKPLSQQSEKVRTALSDVAGYFENNKSTAEAIRKLQSDFGGPMFAQSEFEKRGIPGIRYLDQGSRAAGQGSRNYVVFDDNLIEILRKYGLLGTLGAGYALAGGDQAEAAPSNALARR